MLRLFFCELLRDRVDERVGGTDIDEIIISISYTDELAPFNIRAARWYRHLIILMVTGVRCVLLHFHCLSLGTCSALKVALVEQRPQLT